MNQLINSDNLTMSSREIAELTGKQLSHIHRDFKSMAQDLGFYCENTFLMPSPNMDQGFTYEMDEQKRIKTIFLNRELTLTLVSGYSAKLRNAIIKRWQELESKQLQPALPANYIEALESLISSEKEKAVLSEQLQIAKPAVEFVEKYTQADSGSKGFRQVAKILKANERIFREFLIDMMIMYKSKSGWMAYQRHVDAKRFEVITGEKNSHIYNEVLFTGKGIEWVAGLWAIELIALGEEK